MEVTTCREEDSSAIRTEVRQEGGQDYVLSSLDVLKTPFVFS